MKASCLQLLPVSVAAKGKNEGDREKRYIPSTIPQVEHKVSQKFDRAMFDIYGSAEAAYVFGDIVAEDDAAHG